MLGFKFAKAQPTDYVIEFKNGKPRREGAGLSVIYFAPTTSLMVVPTSSMNEPFIFEEETLDYQSLTVQGQITYHIYKPHRAAEMLNFTLAPNGKYVSEDLKLLPRRVLEQVRVVLKAEIRAMNLKQALSSADNLESKAMVALGKSSMFERYGIELLGLSILAIKAKPETAKALEADARENLLRIADEAIYARRNAAVEQERAIKENELNTEIAIKNKEREITEVKMQTEKEKIKLMQQIKEEEMAGKIKLEEQNGELIKLSTANAKEQSEAQAYGIEIVMKAFATSDASVLQSLASIGMKPGQMMALAFRDIAGNANKIGQLNLSPDLLREIMASK
ncbi:MAG: SPFH domain-containing protein [Alphaproteobacteria bacterium]